MGNNEGAELSIEERIIYMSWKRHSLLFLSVSYYKAIRYNQNVQIITNITKQLAPVVQTLDSAIHRLKIYPADGVIGFPNTYPLDSDLSGG